MRLWKTMVAGMGKGKWGYPGSDHQEVPQCAVPSLRLTFEMCDCLMKRDTTFALLKILWNIGGITCTFGMIQHVTHSVLQNRYLAIHTM